MNTQSIPNPENIHRVSLDNGLTILSRANHSAPVVVLRGSLPAGAVHDPPNLVGLSSFVSAMLTRGSRHYDFDSFNQTIESVGASLSAGSDTHRTDFNLTCLSEDFPTLIEVLADITQYPVFPQEQIDLVRTQKLIGVQEREQDTQSMAYLHFYETLYGREHPYGRSISGYSDSISAVTQDGLQSFHNERFTPAGAIFSVAGDIEPDKLTDLVRHHFADWTGSEADQHVPPIHTPDQVSRYDHVMPDKVQSDIVIGCPAVNRGHPDYYALRVADTILGKFGMMGRLGVKVREEQGLAYYSYSNLDTELHTGLWLAAAGVNPANVQLAIDSILAEFDRLASELVPEAELTDSQDYMTGSLPIGLETNSGVASTLHNMELNELGLDYLQRYGDLIRSITPADVQRVANTYLQLDKYALVVAGPDVTASQA